METEDCSIFLGDEKAVVRGPRISPAPMAAEKAAEQAVVVHQDQRRCVMDICRLGEPILVVRFSVDSPTPFRAKGKLAPADDPRIAIYWRMFDRLKTVRNRSYVKNEGEAVKRNITPPERSLSLVISVSSQSLRCFPYCAGTYVVSVFCPCLGCRPCFLFLEFPPHLPGLREAGWFRYIVASPYIWDFVCARSLPCHERHDGGQICSTRVRFRREATITATLPPPDGGYGRRFPVLAFRYFEPLGRLV